MKTKTKLEQEKEQYPCPSNFQKKIGMQVNKWEDNSNSKSKGVLEYVLCKYTCHIVYMIN